MTQTQRIAALLTTTLLWLALATTLKAAPTVHPAAAAVVTARIILFYDQEAAANGGYTLEVAHGNITDTAIFSHQRFLQTPYDTGGTIAEVPAFGAQYTWRITGKGVSGSLHHFSTGYNRYADTNYFRLTVHRKAVQYSDAYVFLDGHGTLYNMAGEPVWYFPLLQPNEILGTTLRDLKLTPAHTITCLYRGRPMEIDWDGNILWQAPAAGDTAPFHHECTQLENGQYLTLGNTLVAGKTADRPISFGTVQLYDSKGNLTFKWLSEQLYRNTNYYYGQFPGEPYDVHQNAAFLNLQTGDLYVGFKNISQVVRLKFPSGKVAAVYGNSYPNGAKPIKGPFAEQHSIHITNDGHMYVFDNHNTNKKPDGFHPRLLVLKATGNQPNNLTELWHYEYSSPYESTDIPPVIVTSGGNFVPLTADTYFASMCSPFANLFLVNKNKELLWEATPCLYEEVNRSWRKNAQYRASVIPSQQALFQLIQGR